MVKPIDRVGLMSMTSTRMAGRLGLSSRSGWAYWTAHLNICFKKSGLHTQGHRQRAAGVRRRASMERWRLTLHRPKGPAHPECRGRKHVAGTRAPARLNSRRRQTRVRRTQRAGHCSLVQGEAAGPATPCEQCHAPGQVHRDVRLHKDVVLLRRRGGGAHRRAAACALPARQLAAAGVSTPAGRRRRGAKAPRLEGECLCCRHWLREERRTARRRPRLHITPQPLAGRCAAAGVWGVRIASLACARASAVCALQVCRDAGSTVPGSCSYALFQTAAWRRAQLLLTP